MHTRQYILPEEKLEVDAAQITIAMDIVHTMDSVHTVYMFSNFIYLDLFPLWYNFSYLYLSVQSSLFYCNCHNVSL